MSNITTIGDGHGVRTGPQNLEKIQIWSDFVPIGNQPRPTSPILLRAQDYISCARTTIGFLREVPVVKLSEGNVSVFAQKITENEGDLRSP